MKTALRFLAYLLTAPVLALLFCAWPVVGLYAALGFGAFYWGLMCWNMANGKGPIA